MILLRSSEKGGATFVRTDQLDGETDWKLRKAVQYCNNLPTDDSLFKIRASFFGMSNHAILTSHSHSKQTEEGHL